MTASTTVTKTSGLTVINLKVTKEGNIERKMTDVSPQAQLNNTLLEALCPGIRVASVTVTPEPLDQVERARVESALSRFNVDGIDYRLIGASGSASVLPASLRKAAGIKISLGPGGGGQRFGLFQAG